MYLRCVTTSRFAIKVVKFLTVIWHYETEWMTYDSQVKGKKCSNAQINCERGLKEGSKGISELCTKDVGLRDVLAPWRLTVERIPNADFQFVYLLRNFKSIQYLIFNEVCQWQIFDSETRYLVWYKYNNPFPA